MPSKKPASTKPQQTCLRCGCTFSKTGYACPACGFRVPREVDQRLEEAEHERANRTLFVVVLVFVFLVLGGILVTRLLDLGATPEQTVVRRWLSQTTPNGTWSEVRWWNGVEAPFGGRVLRMIYRTEDADGNPMSVDAVFVIQDEQVVYTAEFGEKPLRFQHQYAWYLSNFSRLYEESSGA